MDNEKRTASGNLKISQDVISSITAYCLREVEGVASLASLGTNLKGWLQAKRPRKAILVELNEDVATITVHVNVMYGAKIREVAENIQRSVKDAVQSMTGIAVAKVNVVVSGIAFRNPKAEEEE